MLKKCLKYDLKSNLFIWLLLSVGMLIMSVPGGLSMRYLKNYVNNYISLAAGLVEFIYYLLGVVYFVAGLGLGIYRFYQNFRTDEAYLTFTLPVKRKILLHSKILATLIMFIATLAVIFTSIMIAFMLVPDGEQSYFETFIRGIYEGLCESYVNYGFWSIVYLVQGFVLTLEVIIGMILFSFSIANRSPGSKNKSKSNIAKNITTLILFYLIMGLLSVPTILLVVAIMYYNDATLIAQTVGPGEANVITFLTYIMFTMASAILNLILYKDNRNMIENKLNLA